MALLALVNHVVKFDFQALLSFDRLQARITSTKSRFIQVAANDSLRVADYYRPELVFVSLSAVLRPIPSIFQEPSALRPSVSERVRQKESKREHSVQ